MDGSSIHHRPLVPTKDRFAARITCNMLYRSSQRLVAGSSSGWNTGLLWHHWYTLMWSFCEGFRVVFEADLEHQDWAAAQFPPEEEQVHNRLFSVPKRASFESLNLFGQENDYSDDLEDDPFDEDEEARGRVRRGNELRERESWRAQPQAETRVFLLEMLAEWNLQ